MDVRRIDNLNRVVIPKAVMRALMLQSGESVEMHVERGSLVLKKYEPNPIAVELDKIRDEHSGSLTDAQRDLLDKLIASLDCTKSDE